MRSRANRGFWGRALMMLFPFKRYPAANSGVLHYKPNEFKDIFKIFHFPFLCQVEIFLPMNTLMKTTPSGFAFNLSLRSLIKATTYLSKS
jgi:hypothetical protein